MNIAIYKQMFHLVKTDRLCCLCQENLKKILNSLYNPQSKAMLINPSILRLTWAAIEEIHNRELISLTDTALVKRILQQVTRKILLNGEEVYALDAYISARMPLIRDMAESRLI